MLPQELERIFEEYTEDNYSFSVIKATTEQEFSLDFLLRIHDFNGKGEILQTWTVEAIGYKKSQVSFEPADLLTIAGESPLLWEFTDVHGELYFSGKIKDPAKLFVDLYQTHKMLFGNYHSPDLSFIEKSLYSGDVPYSNGQIAKGPRKLLEFYANCLEQNGLKSSIVGRPRSEAWSASGDMPENPGLFALFLGNTCVIAEKFLFQKR